MDIRTRRGKRPVPAALAAVAAFTALVACADGSGGDGGTAATAPAPAKDAVTMQLIAFKPELLTVGAGTTVTWNQQDPGVHTVTSGTVEQRGGAGVTTVPDGGFDSGPIATGRTFAFRFERAGTYRYFCSVHPATMRGEVQVR